MKEILKVEHDLIVYYYDQLRLQPFLRIKFWLTTKSTVGHSEGT